MACAQRGGGAGGGGDATAGGGVLNTCNGATVVRVKLHFLNAKSAKKSLEKITGAPRLCGTCLESIA